MTGVGAAWLQNWVVLVYLKGIATIVRERDILAKLSANEFQVSKGCFKYLGLALRGVDSVDRNYTVSLIGEHARGVVAINDGRPGENAFFLGAREDGNLLVRPGVQILAGGVPPVLFAGNVGCRIICTV